jgi:hypothetical protein
METCDRGIHLYFIGSVHAYGLTCLSVGLQIDAERGQFQGPAASFLFDWEETNE